MNIQFNISLIVTLKKIETKLHPKKKKKHTNDATLSHCVIYRQISCELQSSGIIPRSLKSMLVHQT